jgi:hypothetical protein
MKFNCFFLLPFMDEFPAYLVSFPVALIDWVCVLCSQRVQRCLKNRFEHYRCTLSEHFLTLRVLVCVTLCLGDGALASTR